LCSACPSQHWSIVFTSPFFLKLFASALTRSSHCRLSNPNFMPYLNVKKYHTILHNDFWNVDC
jgi:hypothetical protein